MDPQSRREMWSIIEEASEISTIILTSHSMEECEGALFSNWHPAQRSVFMHRNEAAAYPKVRRWSYARHVLEGR